MPLPAECAFCCRIKKNEKVVKKYLNLAGYNNKFRTISTMHSVYITRLSKFLPFEPVGNDEMETVLGAVGGKPSRVRRLILKNNGIKTRYYAIGHNGESYTNAEMTAKTIRALLKDENELEQIELLACGTGSPDQLLPGHASMVQGVLKCADMPVYSFAGACNTGIQALKTAFLSIATGDAENAVATGSERASGFLKAERFRPEVDKSKEIEANGYIAFEKDFLRWMLSDGAGAAFLENKPNIDGVSLKIEWIELTSCAGRRETCMYSGAVKNGKGLIGYNDLTGDDWLNKSAFSFKQDTELLGENIVPLGLEFLRKVITKRKLVAENIDWFLPHLSSEFFREKIKIALKENGINIAEEAWFTNLSSVGNVGAASPFLMLEELFNEGKFKKGEKILMMIPESARFSYSYALMTVV